MPGPLGHPQGKYPGVRGLSLDGGSARGTIASKLRGGCLLITFTVGVHAVSLDISDLITTSTKIINSNCISITAISII